MVLHRPVELAAVSGHNLSTILANSLCRYFLKAMSVLVASRAVIFLASAHGGRAFDEEFISAYSVATPMCRRTPEATGADSVFQHFHSRGIRY